MADTNPEPKVERLVSLDAYRGFVMLAMASSAFGLASAMSKPEMIHRYDNSGLKSTWQWLCGQLAFHAEHVPWAGGGFWDLIQPSFMFMVGVALPFSFANRQALGQSGFVRFLHVLKRSLVLILLGVFLSSNGAAHTNYTFVNVLTQIGLGYPIVWLLVYQSTSLKLFLCTLILGGYWYLFYRHPLPGPDFNLAAVGLPPDWTMYDGLAAHWNKNTNWASAIDLKLMNLFPQYKDGKPHPFAYNAGGYQTLNFIPSIVTMIFGLMAGERLRSPHTPRENTWRLLWTGALCLVIGLAMDPRLVTSLPLSWTTCPIVKRIWTPSWVFFSSGWTLWMLAAFYWVIDVKGWKAWAFPLVIVGMNSIAMYVGAQLLKPWIKQTWRTHFGGTWLDASTCPVAESAAVLFVLWLMCLWMYRRRIFVRI